jgi:hypothetical protein
MSWLAFDGIPRSMFDMRSSNQSPRFGDGATCSPLASYGGENRL